MWTATHMPLAVCHTSYVDSNAHASCSLVTQVMWTATHMPLVNLRFDGDRRTAVGHGLNESVESTGMAVFLNNVRSAAHERDHFC
jgi:hypothetical protein